ncbi:hypothetical protein QQM79_03515 [Marinobacteraceae bacterium S3BR75-40.1]
MNPIEFWFFTFAFVVLFLAMLLFVVFGQVTVRKLRKNPEIKGKLGMEYVSGWDIINVAQALSFPESWSRKLESGPLSFLYANQDLIKSNTNNLDKFLGVTFYISLMISGFSIILLVLLNTFGVFD